MQTLTFSLKLYNFGPQNLRWIFLDIFASNVQKHGQEFWEICTPANSYVCHSQEIQEFLFGEQCGSWGPLLKSYSILSAKFPLVLTPPSNSLPRMVWIVLPLFKLNFHKSLHPFSELHCFLSAFLFKLGPLYDSLVTSRFHCKKQFKTSIP